MWILIIHIRNIRENTIAENNEGGKVNELISIVVPVYKVEKYIDQCIQSILKQTYANWELILVDDGSPDRCGEICDNYAKKDDRIIVIHKENGGLSEARNVTFDVIKGKYITFIDSDDSISIHYLEEMTECMDRYGADVVQCDFTRNESEIERPTSKNKVTVLRSTEIMREFLRFGKPKVFACGKLYKANLFHEIRFPVGLIDEDNFTTYKIFFKTKIFININKYLYFYRTNQESITNRSFGIQKFNILNCVKEIRGLLEEKAEIYKRDIEYYEMRQLVQIYNNAVYAQAEEEFADELAAVKERLCRLSKSNIKIDHKYKMILFFLLKYGFIYKKIVLLVRN